MRLLVSGYRFFSNKQLIEDEIIKILSSSSDKNHTIIHGACSGVDRTAHQIAKEQKWDVDPYPYIRSLGKAGGPVRNEQMATKGKPDHALLFLHSKSTGTLNMLEIVKRYNIPYTLIYI